MGDGGRAAEGPTPHGLNAAQVGVIRGVLMPFAGRISLVGLFGSRATGKWRPESDIDLVLYGALTAGDIDRIRTLFMESSLPMQVDICLYDQIRGTPLCAHVDRVMRPLFQGEMLAAA